MIDRVPLAHDVLHAVWDFARAWTVRPTLVVPLVLLAAILLGSGKALGLPRLFWSKFFFEQLRVGFAAGIVVYEGVLATALLHLQASHPAMERSTVLQHVAWFALVSFLIALGFLLTAAALAHRIRQNVPGRLSPAIRTVDGAHRGPPTEGGVAPFAFLLGTGGAAVVAAGTVAVGFALGGSLGAPLQRVIGPTQVPELHLAALVSGGLLFLAFCFARHVVPAGVAICVLFGLIIGVHGVLSFTFNSSGLELLALVMLLLLGATSRTRIAFSDLEAEYPRSKSHPYPPPLAPAADLLPFSTALDALEKQGQHKLILVCVSGGGIRAATWTAAILRKLQDLHGFFPAARWISGASGGMVGVAFWRAAAGQLTFKELVETTAMDSLSPTVQQLVYNDVIRTFTPGRNRFDRGSALQAAWQAHLKSKNQTLDLAVPIRELRASEQDGTWPSLVFSPMLVEDGRRLLVSNLDLQCATDHRAIWLRPTQATPALAGAVSSQTAYALEQLCPGALDKVSLATAARMSASFPYVSPATPLPTDPVRRVVDAGYYDNYGVELACSWVRALAADPGLRLRARVERILVIQVRDNVSELSVSPGSDLRHQLRATPGALARAFQGFTGPVEGILSARDSAMLFRNDGQLEALTQLLNAPGREDFLTTIAFEFGAEASLGWRLDSDERQLLVDQASSPGIAQKLEAVGRWLNPPASGAAAGPSPSGHPQASATPV